MVWEVNDKAQNTKALKFATASQAETTAKAMYNGYIFFGKGTGKKNTKPQHYNSNSNSSSNSISIISANKQEKQHLTFTLFYSVMTGAKCEN